MKKSLVCILIVCALVGLAACNHSTTTVTPQDTLVTVRFVVDEIYWPVGADEFDLPTLSLKAGEALGELPLPEEAVLAVDDHSGFVWCYDQQGEEDYDPTRAVETDLTLYLVEKGLQYTITYHYDESLTFEGDFPATYRYGERTTLPNADLGNGYRDKGNWYYGESSYWTVAIPVGTYGDLDLTFRGDPISYRVNYRSGIVGVGADEIDNPNPSTWNIELGKVMPLAPASYQGKTFVGWVVRFNAGSSKSFDVDGETVTYTHLQRVEYLDFPLVQWGQFQLEPIWE